MISVPSKTFLMGEYGVLAGGPALVLNTEPRFELHSSTTPTHNFHPDSPAAKFLTEVGKKEFFKFFDPHHGAGGVGASSAEFLALYQSIHGSDWTHDDLLKDYKRLATTGKIQPSGVDVLAQAVGSVAYIDVRKRIFEPLNWNFSELSFILVKTGTKIPTHQHLSDLVVSDFSALQNLTQVGIEAFIAGNTQGLLESVSLFQRALVNANLVARSTLDLLEKFNSIEGVVASKGCGAMGADVVLLLVWSEDRDDVVAKLNSAVFATEDDLTDGLRVTQDQSVERTHDI